MSESGKVSDSMQEVLEIDLDLANIDRYEEILRRREFILRQQFVTLKSRRDAAMRRRDELLRGVGLTELLR